MPQSSKNLLIISPFEDWPLSQGTIVRTHHIVQFLAQSHKIWFAFRHSSKAAQKTTAYIPIVNSSQRFSQLFNPRFLYRLWRTIRHQNIDIILVCQLWAALHGILLKWLTKKPFLFDHHNVEYLRFRRIGHWIWPGVALLEWLACHAANSILCVSEIDKSLLTHTLHIPPHKIQVAANGVNIGQRQQHLVDSNHTKQMADLKSDEAMVLFFGSLTHIPNAQAADIILDELAPRLAAQAQNSKIVIAGLGNEVYLQTRKLPLPTNVIFTGFINDITALIKSADLIIVPLLSGSGTRFKIIESAACVRPIISTSLGAEGLDRAAFGDLLTICDDWDEFTHHIVYQLSHPRRYQLPTAFHLTYDWQHIFAKVDWSILDG